MSRFVDIDAFKEWLLENSINEREVEESKQIGIWLDAFESMQNEQSDCEDCIKNGGDYECDRKQCHKGISNEFIRISVYEQCKWERDLAVQQLNDLGYGLGEKPREEEDVICRQDAIDVIKNMHDAAWNNWKDHRISPNIAIDMIKELPSCPLTTTLTIGRKKGETILWYECDNCGEAVDIKDCFCSNCGRRIIARVF